MLQMCPAYPHSGHRLNLLHSVMCRTGSEHKCRHLDVACVHRKTLHTWVFWDAMVTSSDRTGAVACSPEVTVLSIWVGLG